MRVALVSNRVTDDIQENQEKIILLAERACSSGAELVLFPEAAATGLANCGEPSKDYLLTEALLGPRTQEWSDFAKEQGVYFAAGFLEREGKRIYDSAVLFDPEGDCILHHRRNDPGWHGEGDNPSVYCEGRDVPIIDTPFGRAAFLICGELWSDKIVARLMAKEPSILLYPFARSMSITDDIRLAWNRELQDYIKHWRTTQATVLAVNIYDETRESIGGAWICNMKDGLTAESQILQEIVLMGNISSHKT